MKKQYKLSLVVGAILLASIACSFSLTPDAAAPDAAADESAIATSVAMTLEAGGGADAGAPTGAPSGPPADVPGGSPPGGTGVLRIAYVDGGDLWLWSEGAGATEIYDGAFDVQKVRLSDDGAVAAFTLYDSYTFMGLWAVNRDGSSARELVSAATVAGMGDNPDAMGTEPYMIEFVPGSHTLAFNTQQFYQGPGQDIQNDLHLVDADSAVLTTLLASGQAGTFYYSPDGSQIALVTPTTISLVDADGSHRRDNVLVYDSVITYSEYAWYALPLWAADSRSLRVAIPSADILADDATVGVYEIPTDGSPGRSLGSTGAEPLSLLPQQLLSPDMQKLAFTRTAGAPEDNNWELHIADLSTFSLSYYHMAPYLRFQAWSPDSTRFVFEQSGHLYVGQMGSSPIALPDTGSGTEPVWVDAGRVLYLSGSMGSWELRMQTVGGGLVTIATPASESVWFDFSF